MPATLLCSYLEDQHHGNVWSPSSPEEQERWHGARNRKCAAFVAFRLDSKRPIVCPFDDTNIVSAVHSRGNVSILQERIMPHTQSLRDPWIYIYLYIYIFILTYLSNASMQLVIRVLSRSHETNRCRIFSRREDNLRITQKRKFGQTKL